MQRGPDQLVDALRSVEMRRIDVVDAERHGAAEHLDGGLPLRGLPGVPGDLHGAIADAATGRSARVNVPPGRCSVMADMWRSSPARGETGRVIWRTVRSVHASADA